MQNETSNSTSTWCEYCKHDPCRCAENRAESDQRKALESKRKVVGTLITLEESQERDRVNLQMSNALVRICNEHDILIPQRDRDAWRATIPQEGEVEGFEHFGNMICLITDGLQAYFLRHDGSVWLGHVQCFKWVMPPFEPLYEGQEEPQQKFGAPPPLFSASKGSGSMKSSAKTTKLKRKSAVERALDFLRLQNPTSLGEAEVNQDAAG